MTRSHVVLIGAVLLSLVGGCRSSEQSEPKETSVTDWLAAEKQKDPRLRMFAEETLPVILQKLSTSLQANGLPPCDETNVEWFKPFRIRISRNAKPFKGPKGEGGLRPASDGYAIDVYFVYPEFADRQTRFAYYMNSDEDFEACGGGWGPPGVELGSSNDGLEKTLGGIITRQLAEQERRMRPEDSRYWKYLDADAQ